MVDFTLFKRPSGSSNQALQTVSRPSIMKRPPIMEQYSIMEQPSIILQTEVPLCCTIPRDYLAGTSSCTTNSREGGSFEGTFANMVCPSGVSTLTCSPACAPVGALTDRDCVHVHKVRDCVHVHKVFKHGGWWCLDCSHACLVHTQRVCFPRSTCTHVHKPCHETQYCSLRCWLWM
jgi:hypothetical protein